MQHCNDSTLILQAASIYTLGDGRRWKESEMAEAMMDIATSSLQMLGRDLFHKLSGGETGV